MMSVAAQASLSGFLARALTLSLLLSLATVSADEAISFYGLGGVESPTSSASFLTPLYHIELTVAASGTAFTSAKVVAAKSRGLINAVSADALSWNGLSLDNAQCHLYYGRLDKNADVSANSPWQNFALDQVEVKGVTWNTKDSTVTSIGGMSNADFLVDTHYYIEENSTTIYSLKVDTDPNVLTTVGQKFCTFDLNSNSSIVNNTGMMVGDIAVIEEQRGVPSFWVSAMLIPENKKVIAKITASCEEQCSCTFKELEAPKGTDLFGPGGLQLSFHVARADATGTQALGQLFGFHSSSGAVHAIHPDTGDLMFNTTLENTLDPTAAVLLTDITRGDCGTRERVGPHRSVAVTYVLVAFAAATAAYLLKYFWAKYQVDYKEH